MNSLLISRESKPVAPSVETLGPAAVVAAEGVGVKIVAVGFKLPPEELGLKVLALRLAANSDLIGLNS